MRCVVETPASVASTIGRGIGPQVDGLTIAYVLFIFPVLSETFVANEMLALQRRGVELSILAWMAPEDRPEYTLTNKQHAFVGQLMPRVTYMLRRRHSRRAALSANFALLTSRGLRHYLWAYRLARRYRLIGGWRSFLQFAVWGHQLRRQGVARLHAHFATEATAIAHVLSVLSGLPFSFTAHAHDIYIATQWLPEKMRAADFVTTVCDANRQRMLALCPDIPPGKVRIVHCGIDVDLFEPKPRTDKAEFCILSVGRLVKTKGHADLIGACDQLKRRGVGFECLIVGEGPCRPQLERMISEAGLADRVRLLGALPREQVLSLLDRADLFVLPCFVDPATGDRDGVPVALMEAMAKELPVVTTPVSGIPELVQEGAGLLVPERDAEALAAAIQMVWAMSPEDRRSIGRRGRQVVQTEFNLDVEVGRLLAQFQGQGTRSSSDHQDSMAVRAG